MFQQSKNKIYLSNSNLQQKNIDEGAESYATPAVSSELGLIIVGTGGETLPGHLIALDYLTLEEIWRVPSYGKGFLSSPILYSNPTGQEKEVV